MAIREGRWDCPVCGRVGNRGPEKHCAGCGHPRGPEVPFYLPEDAPEVTDRAALDLAAAGPDWSCTYCGGDNRADAEHCTGCGAGRDGAPPRPVVEHLDQPPPVQAVADLPGGTPPPPKKKKKSKKGCFAIGCLGLLAFLALLIFCGGPSEVEVAVSGLEWQRTVAVEKLVTVTEEGWEDEVPEGAREIERKRERYGDERERTGSERKTRTVEERVQVGTERVKVGVRDLGNGYFEDIYEERPVYETRTREETYDEPVYTEEPVYKDKVRYQVDQWRAVRTEEASGAGGNPRWPRLSLGPKERQGERTERYLVRCSGDGKSYTYQAKSEDEWRRYRRGDRYLATVRGDRAVELKRR